jgi:CheY-like chemotaxis protein
MKILIADDDTVLVTMLSAGLRTRGHTVVVARDAMQAVMFAIQSQPDAILLDINMPGGTGLNVLRRLKASSKTESIPVLVLSGSSDPALPDTVQQLGAAAFMSKPVDPAALVEELTRTVSASDTNS